MNGFTTSSRMRRAECVVKVVVCIEKGRGRREGEKERGRGRGILVDASNDSFSADPR